MGIVFGGVLWYDVFGVSLVFVFSCGAGQREANQGEALFALVRPAFYAAVPPESKAGVEGSDAVPSSHRTCTKSIKHL